MSCKYVDPVRWQTPDFFELPSSSKLLFCYFYDNCDLAGFIPVNKPLWSVYTGIPKDELDKVIDTLSEFVIVEDGIAWLCNHLVDNRNFPLNERNKAHRSIINLFERNSNHISSFKYYSSLTLQDTTRLYKDYTRQDNTGEDLSSFDPPSSNDKIGLKPGELLQMRENAKSSED